MHKRMFVSLVFVFGLTAIAWADVKDAEFTKRGPLDGHAALVQGVLDTIELSEEQKPQLKAIVAEGHVAWRTWYRENHEKVDAHQAAVQAAKTSGDRKKLAEVRKLKKAFMHTAPSLLRQPESVRQALTESQRKVFDERLDELKRQLHVPPARRPVSPEKTQRGAQ